MFLNFYGLSEQPFGTTPDPEYLYLSATHREALASVAYGIQAGVGFATVIAKPGMGKTTLLFALLRHFQSSTQSAFLFDTQCNSRELLQNLLDEFKVRDETRRNDTPPLALLRQFLLKSACAKQPVLLVVDEAQNLDIPVFETLRLLSNFETPHAKLLHIVLAGQPELARKLTKPELDQLRQRIAIATRLEALNPAEVIQYVAHRLKRAGYQGNSPFTPEALGILVERARGVPREINRLCFNALSLGCAVGEKQVDGRLMREAVEDLEFGFSFAKQEQENDREYDAKIPAADELATLLDVALTKEPAGRLAPEVKLKKTESENPAGAGDVRANSREQSKIWPEGSVSQPTKAGNFSASAKIDSTAVDAAGFAPLGGLRDVPAQGMQQKAPNRASCKPSIDYRKQSPARVKQSPRAGFLGLVWPWSLLGAAMILGGLIWLSNSQSRAMFTFSGTQTRAVEAQGSTIGETKEVRSRSGDQASVFARAWQIAQAYLNFNSETAPPKDDEEKIHSPADRNASGQADGPDHNQLFLQSSGSNSGRQ